MMKRKLILLVYAFLMCTVSWAQTTYSETYDLTGRDAEDWSLMLKKRTLAGKEFEVFVNGTNEHALVWGGSTTTDGLDVGGRDWGATAFAFRNVSKGDKVAITVNDASTLSELSLYANSNKISYTDAGATRTFSIDDTGVSAIEISFPQNGTRVIMTKIVYSYQLPSGFTKVTSTDDLTSENFANNYYVIAAETYPGLVITFNTTRGGNGNTDLSYKAQNVSSDPYQLWMFETDEDGKFSIRNVVKQALLVQTESYGAYPMRHNDQANVCEWTQIVPTADEQGGFTFQWEKYSGNYFGLWTPANDFFDGEYLAGNKTETKEIGHYNIYSIPRSTLDFTSFITNAAVASTTSWTGATVNSGEQYTGAPDSYYLDYCYWGTEGTTGTTDMYQTLSGLPAGVYTLKAATRSHSEVSTAYIYAAQGGSNIAKADCNKDGNTGGTLGNGWSWTEFRFVKPNANEMNIGFYSVTGRSIWVGADDFHLYYHGEVPSDADKTAFNTALTTANEKTLGFDIGEYAPYTNTSAITTRIAANAIDANTATKKELTSAISALTGATWTVNTVEKNAFYDGTFQNTAVGHIYSGLTGWTSTGTVDGTSEKSVFRDIMEANKFEGGKAFYMWSTIAKYGETTGYTMPLKANTWYEFTYSYAGQKSGMETPTISVLNSSSEGLSATSTGGADIYTTSVRTYTAQFKTGAAGNYIFTYTAPGNTNTMIGNLSLKRANITITEDATVAPSTGIANVTLERAFNAGWNAVCLPFAADAFDDAIIADFTGETIDGDNVTLELTKVDAFEANKPYLVYFPSAVASGKTFSQVEIKSGTIKTSQTAFDFMGTMVMTDIDAGSWVISGGKLKKASTAISLKPTRTYFVPKSGSGARIANFNVDGETPTGITFYESDNQLEFVNEAYNLSGQKMNGKLKKGIYIVNGKKTVVK